MIKDDKFFDMFDNIIEKKMPNCPICGYVKKYYVSYLLNKQGLN